MAQLRENTGPRRPLITEIAVPVSDPQVLVKLRRRRFRWVLSRIRSR